MTERVLNLLLVFTRNRAGGLDDLQKAVCMQLRSVAIISAGDRQVRALQ